MTRNKPFAKKRRLNKANKSRIAGPVWALLKKFGKRKTHRWRLNPHKRRHWRSSSLNK
ncbi:MAG: 50S ribosomal protein L39e [Candidatus Nanoarchaeia archaeon]